MSEVYIKEPETEGKVILRTTMGDLEVELWAREAPKACRNFCTLVMEGYYDNTIFHRVIKDFIIQGGDATGTGQGCESIYGKPYPDEIHPRLKFRYRGMMGIASAGKKDVKSNGSQFFIIMDRTPSLDGKHTLFAKVVGQTVYNLVRISDVQVDKQDRPMDPPRILRAELVWDPFGDLEPRFKPPVAAIPSKPSDQPHRRDAIKNRNVLSFGGGADSDDDAEADEAFGKVAGKVKSAHDVLNDPRLSKEAAYKGEDKGRAKSSSEKAPSKAAPQAAQRQDDSEDEKESSADSEPDFGGEEDDEQGEDSDRGESGADQKARQRQEAILKLKRDIAGIGATPEQAPKRQKEQGSLVEELRAGFEPRVPRAKLSGKEAKRQEAEALQKLMKSFGSRVKQVASDATAAEAAKAAEGKDARKDKEEGTFSAIWEEGDEESTTDWLAGGGLKFHTSADKAFKLESLKAKEQLEIFDPLAAKGNNEVMAEQRKRRSEQLKPSLRRQEPPKW
mmetsp:Transcript_63281/g.150934  ORF Transcript_63281/g.150934 Transcript_63281/m.150934 type:complete len:504 (+) Transcript_63281:98-1609(+)